MGFACCKSSHKNNGEYNPRLYMTVASHYLKHCLSTINEILLHSFQGKLYLNTQPQAIFENQTCEITATSPSPRANELLTMLLSSQCMKQRGTLTGTKKTWDTFHSNKNAKFSACHQLQSSISLIIRLGWSLHLDKSISSWAFSW